MICDICQHRSLDTDDERAMLACASCAETYGLIAMPPPRRPARPCATCNGLRFLRAIPRQHSVEPGSEPPEQLSAPLLLTHLPRHPEALDLRTGVGRLEVYICKTCGRVEWFCTDVEAIPAHPHLMTDVVDYASGNPYR